MWKLADTEMGKMKFSFNNYLKTIQESASERILLMATLILTLILL